MSKIKKSTQLKKLQDEEGPHNLEQIWVIQKEVDTLLEQRGYQLETMGQKKLVSLEDRNTKYFYTYATQRRKKKWIKSVHDGEGRVRV